MAFTSGLSRLRVRNDWNFHKARQFSTRNQDGGYGRPPHGRLINRLGYGSTGFPSFVNSPSNSVSTTSGAVRFPEEFCAGIPTSPSNLVTNFYGLSLRPKFGYRQFSTTNSKGAHGEHEGERYGPYNGPGKETSWKTWIGRIVGILLVLLLVVYLVQPVRDPQNVADLCPPDPCSETPP